MGKASIFAHRLAWRWTDPAYAVLPGEVLAQMHPCSSQEAKDYHNNSLPFLSVDGLSSDFHIASKSSEQLSPLDGSAWLRSQESDLDQDIVLSWDPDTALRTTWKVFTAYWPEFCYPASDDVFVFPELDNWVFLFHHEQEFHFGRRAMNG